MKHLKNYTVEDELIRIGFEEVSKSEFDEYVEENEEMGEDCENESEFGFLTEDSYTIIKLGILGESLAYYGNGNFLVTYNNRYFSGYWNEMLYETSKKDWEDFLEDIPCFNEFLIEMKKQNINYFFRDSF